MKKILLHEPDAFISEIITLVLTDQNYTVKTFDQLENTDLQLELMQYQPDLVIIDCFIDSIQPALWCKKIKTISNDICVIVSSCNNDISATYKKMGFDSFLSKPFDIDYLTNLVARYTRPFAHC